MRYIPAMLLPFAALVPGAATAGDMRHGSPDVEVVEPVRGVGCYWDAGRMYCSRYCYIEINGRQYCHSRLRHARAQGPVTILPGSVYVRSKRQTMK